jgi:putative phosphoribosyl transferase
MKFCNRIDAGRHLAERLRAYVNRQNVIVLALPRGGVPVGYEVARLLNARFDVFVVRKLGLPFHPEVAMGAIAEGGLRVLNQRMIDDAHIPSSTVDQIVAREEMELERRSLMYRSGRELPPLYGCTVIVVDDGLATGATMEVAVRALRRLTDGKIIVAAPVCAEDTCWRLHGIADEVICAFVPEQFTAIGLWYEQFDPTPDAEVCQLLDSAAASHAGAENSAGSAKNSG